MKIVAVLKLYTFRSFNLKNFETIFRLVINVKRYNCKNISDFHYLMFNFEVSRHTENI